MSVGQLSAFNVHVAGLCNHANLLVHDGWIKASTYMGNCSIDAPPIHIQLRSTDTTRFSMCPVSDQKNTTAYVYLVCSLGWKKI